MNTEASTAERGSKEPGQSATITIPGLNKAQIEGAIELLGAAAVKRLATEDTVSAAVDAKLIELAAGLPAEAVAKILVGHTDPQHVDLNSVCLEDAGILGKLLRDARKTDPRLTKINGVARDGTIDAEQQKPADIMIQLSVAPNVFAPSKARTMTMTEIATMIRAMPSVANKLDGYALHFAKFPDGAPKRELSNCGGASGVTLDFDGRDGNTVTRGDLESKVRTKGLAAIFYDSFSADETGTTFRCYLPSATLIPIEHYKSAAQYVCSQVLEIKAPNLLFPASQPYFCQPRIGREPRVTHYLGAPIDTTFNLSDLAPEQVTREASKDDGFANMPEPKLKAPGALAGLLLKLDPDLGRLDWRTVISCIHLHLGEEGREVAREWCMRGKKYLLSLDTPHRPVSKEVADRQFNKVWKDIAKDTSFRMGAGALFNILKHQYEEGDGRFGMSTEDLSRWNDSGRVSGGVEAPDYVDTEANELPFAIDWPVGFVGEIARQIHATSLTRIRSFSIAAGLFAVSLMIGNRFYVRRTDTSLNLYMVLSGKTGEGKEAPRKALNRIFAHTPFMSVIWEKAASATGLLRALENRSPHIFAAMTDEYGLMLQGYSGVKANPNNKDLMALILNLFGSARSTFNPSAYANQRDNIRPIEKPYFTLLGTTTPAMLLAAYTPDLIAARMVNRILVVSAAGHEEEQTDLDFTVPEPIRARVAEFAASLAFTDDDDEDLGRRMDQVRAPDVGLEFAEGAFS